MEMGSVDLRPGISTLPSSIRLMRGYQLATVGGLIMPILNVRYRPKADNHRCALRTSRDFRQRHLGHLAMGRRDRLALE
jgi:hypothetical protein